MFRQLLLLETGSLTSFYYIPKTTSALQQAYMLLKYRFINKLKELLDVQSTSALSNFIHMSSFFILLIFIRDA